MPPKKADSQNAAQGSKGAKPFAVADCETDPFEHGAIIAPFIWGFYDGEVYEKFYSTDDFVSYIKDYEGVVYAHNGGKFDWHFLKNYFESGQNIMLINGRISKVKLGLCELRDSFNIIPTALGNYQKEEVDYGIFKKSERTKPHNKKIIENYLYHDCVYLYDLVTGFRARHGNRLTQAGAALKSWERKCDSEAPQSNAEYYDTFRGFYYGGRVQCFERGHKKEKFSVFDINSAYPTAMLGKHPAGLMYLSAKPKDIAAFVEERPCSVVTLECISDGALPWREEVGKKIYFPDDRQFRKYQVTGHELHAAFEHNAIKAIRGRALVHYWPQLADFKNFIIPLYDERNEAKERGDLVTDILSKLEMNSCYGKFGADPRKYKSYKLFDPENLPHLLAGVDIEGEKRTYDYAGEFGELLLGAAGLYEAEQRFYNVATALSITGSVRAFLYRSKMKCERVLYCDTDSLAVAGSHDLDLGKKLGQWDHEGDFSEWAIAGRKMYAFKYEDESKGWKARSKGVRLTAPQIVDIANGGEITYRFDAPTFSVRKDPYYTSRTIRAEKV